MCESDNLVDDIIEFNDSKSEITIGTNRSIVKMQKARKSPTCGVFTNTLQRQFIKAIGHVNYTTSLFNLNKASDQVTWVII